jgi:hypothetical protein
MFNLYAQSFLEATRFTPNTRPDPRTQRFLCSQSAKPRLLNRLRLRWFNLG